MSKQLEKDLESVSGGGIRNGKISIKFEVIPDGKTTIDDVCEYAKSQGAGTMDISDLRGTLVYKNAVDPGSIIIRQFSVKIDAPEVNHGGHGHVDIVFFD